MNSGLLHAYIQMPLAPKRMDGVLICMYRETGGIGIGQLNWTATFDCAGKCIQRDAQLESCSAMPLPSEWETT